MSLKNLWIATFSLVILGGVLLFCGMGVGETFWGLLGLLIWGGALAWNVCCYRCPHCGRYLDRTNPWRDEFCSRCGGQINWNEK